MPATIPPKSKQLFPSFTARAEAAVKTGIDAVTHRGSLLLHDPIGYSVFFAMTSIPGMPDTAGAAIARTVSPRFYLEPSDAEKKLMMHLAVARASAAQPLRVGASAATRKELTKEEMERVHQVYTAGRANALRMTWGARAHSEKNAQMQRALVHAMKPAPNERYAVKQKPSSFTQLYKPPNEERARVAELTEPRRPFMFWRPSRATRRPMAFK